MRLKPLHVLAILLLVGFLTGSPLIPAAQTKGQPVLIKTLLAEATSYQGHYVTVMGIAHDVEPQPPAQACRRGVTRNGDYVFNLQDESGSIRIEVMGVCGMRGKVDMIGDGESVLIDGFFIQLMSGDLSSPSQFIKAARIRYLPQ